MPPLKFPSSLAIPASVHHSWLDLLEMARVLVEEDTSLQMKAAKGLCLKERYLAPAVLGKAYSQYCRIINGMHEVYLNSVQLQRAPYILDIISVLMKRLYELRKELVHLIVNDYIYVDDGLIQNKLTPQQIELVVPYNFPSECRSDDKENLLKKMWAEAYKRKITPPKPIKIKPSAQPLTSALFGSETDLPVDEEEPEEEEVPEIPQPSVHTIIPEEFIQATIIQAHERFRQWFMVDFKMKCTRRRTYFVQNVVEAPLELRTKAAKLIQKAYREFMRMKRQHLKDIKRDIVLGLIPDPWAVGLNYDEENKKLYDRRRKTRSKLENIFLKEMEKERVRLLVFKQDQQVADITEQIREWFMEWYYGYGFFPEFPHEIEGGTMMVLRGTFPSVEEKQVEDEKIAAATKGKSKDQLKQEKEQAKADAEMKAELDKEAAKKAAENLFKMRCNPLADPGYKVKTSENMGSLTEALQNYRAAWSLFDQLPPEECGETVYGFMQYILTEDLMCQIHQDARKFVDELMRLDLKLLIKSHQAMYKRVGWKYPKLKPRPKPKPPPMYKPVVFNDTVLKSFEDLFDMGIISKPTAKIKDILGDSNYAAYDLNIRDPNVRFPPPGYGDIRSRLILSCCFGIGISPGATRNKAVMLMGPPRNGKSFLVDTVAGELNAAKIDISPEVFSAKLNKPGKKLALVFQAARVFQPTVIFMRNVERVFAKKVMPEDRHLKAKTVKKPLVKLLKSLPADDKVIFIATCTYPKSAKAKALVSPFAEMILVPRTDYGTIRMFLYDKFQRIRSMPRDYCVQALAQLLQGYGFGIIIELFNKIMCAERVVQLNIKPLEDIEFLQALLDEGIEPTTMADYQEYVNFFITKGYLSKEREEYEIINRTREEFYIKLAKKEASQAKEAS